LRGRGGDPPAGKEPRNFGLHRVKQLAAVRRRAEIIQLPPTTPRLKLAQAGSARTEISICPTGWDWPGWLLAGSGGSGRV